MTAPKLTQALREVLQLLGFLLTACGGSVAYPEPPDPAPEASLPEASPPPDASESSAFDARTCGWKCEPISATEDSYVETCTGRICPGTGNCAAKFVPNPCADGGP